jgi:hypothetical protein
MGFACWHLPTALFGMPSQGLCRGARTGAGARSGGLPPTLSLCDVALAVAYQSSGLGLGSDAVRDALDAEGARSQHRS